MITDFVPILDRASTKLEYRKFKDPDIEALIGLMMELGFDHTRHSLERNIRAIHERGGEVFIAELDNDICGCVSAIVDVRLAEGVFGEIVSLVVSKGYRFNGIGKGLIQVAESWLRRYTNCIRVRSLSSRDGAHMFYTRIGYSYCKTQKILEKNL